MLGAGYVGLTTAVLLASAGFKVYVVEPNPQRRDVISRGESFFYEQGINPLLEAAIKAGNLIVTDSYAPSVPVSQAVFSCVGTPDNPDGSSNLTYVHAAAEAAAKLMLPGTLYVQKSTVPVGTGQTIEQLFKDSAVNVTYVSNPEFLREGTAIADTLFFDRVVAGSNSPEATETILGIYHQLENCRGEIAAKAGIAAIERSGSYQSTSLNSAELIKVTANAFLAVKISFANSIAKLADKVDADITQVMDGIGADERIGRAFLDAGRGYGGGCFPKDVSGLLMSSLENGVDLEIMRAAQNVNNSMPGYVVEKLQHHLGDSLKNSRICVLGLAFKAGTSDVRQSPGIKISVLLQVAGASVTAQDPHAASEASELLEGVTISESIDNALQGTQAVIIATEWPEYAEIAPDYFKTRGIKTIVDAVNIYDKQLFQAADLHYIGVGR